MFTFVSPRNNSDHKNTAPDAVYELPFITKFHSPEESCLERLEKSASNSKEVTLDSVFSWLGFFSATVSLSFWNTSNGLPTPNAGSKLTRVNGSPVEVLAPNGLELSGIGKAEAPKLAQLVSVLLVSAEEALCHGLKPGYSAGGVQTVGVRGDTGMAEAVGMTSFVSVSGKTSGKEDVSGSLSCRSYRDCHSTQQNKLEISISSSTDTFLKHIVNMT